MCCEDDELVKQGGRDPSVAVKRMFSVISMYTAATLRECWLTWISSQFCCAHLPQLFNTMVACILDLTTELFCFLKTCCQQSVVVGVFSLQTSVLPSAAAPPGCNSVC